MNLIDELTVFVMVDDDGAEAVLCQSLPGKEGMMVPLVASNQKQFEEMVPAARKIQKASGKSVRVIRLRGRTVLKDRL